MISHHFTLGFYSDLRPTLGFKASLAIQKLNGSTLQGEIGSRLLTRQKI
jgi:hypothetical protein